MVKDGLVLQVDVAPQLSTQTQTRCCCEGIF